MSIFLMIRGADEVLAALDAASEFLNYRRRRSRQIPEVDDVLGVWVRHQLDADLPTWSWFSRSPGAVGTGGQELGHGLRGMAVGIRESVSLSGMWALCWLDGTCLRAAHSPAERRRRALDALVSGAAGVSLGVAGGTFFPVFAATEAADCREATLRQLRERYPQLIGSTWLVDGRERGILRPSHC